MIHWNNSRRKAQDRN